MSNIPTIEEIVKNMPDYWQGGKAQYAEEDVKSAMIEFARIFAIEQLKKHVEHPTKPGYKRHDVINHIKELENDNTSKI